MDRKQENSKTYDISSLNDTKKREMLKELDKRIDNDIMKVRI